MSTYNGLFIRSAIGQDNSLPRPGAQSGCPDIIPYGSKPPNDPTAVFGGVNYGKDLGQNVQGGSPNYIYVRAQNYTNADINNQTIRLFGVNSSLLTMPGNWVAQGLEITNRADNMGDKTFSAKANSVGVLQNPFVWAPVAPPADWHYCLFAILDSPNNNEEAILNVMSVPDLAGYVAQNGGLGWRNVYTAPATATNYISMQSYNQGSIGGNMQVSILTTNLPLNATVSFSAGCPGTIPSVYLAPTPVTTTPSFNIGISSQIPSNWECTFELVVSVPQGTTLPANATVAIQAAFPSNKDMPLYSMGRTLPEMGFHHPDVMRQQMLRTLAEHGQKTVLNEAHYQALDIMSDLYNSYVNVGPVTLITVGENLTRFQ